MADTDTKNQESQSNNKMSDSMGNDGGRYRFMTNIIAESKHRTRYVKGLKKFTIDAQVSYQRIVVALGLGVTILAVGLYQLTHMGGKLKYCAAPVIAGMIALFILLVVYLISSRNKSMLSSVTDMINFQFIENMRRRTNNTLSINSVGIKSCSNGLIRFDNGDVGIMYDVEGQISFSVLPAVAESTARERHRYYIARPDTVQEMLFTSIQRADVRSKLDNMKTIYMDAKESDKPYTEWIEHMSSLIYNYIDEQMGSETQLFQSLILRDVDVESLKKSRQIFEGSCMNGMYAAVMPVTSSAEIARRLRALTLISNTGMEKITGVREEDVDPRNSTNMSKKKIVAQPDSDSSSKKDSSSSNQNQKKESGSSKSDNTMDDFDRDRGGSDSSRD